VESILLSGNRAIVWLEQTLNNRKAVILCDSNTAPHCLPKLSQLATLPVCIMNEGEQAKSINSVENVISFLLEHQITRNDVLINLGGGVVCDLGGFAASIYKRGISFINIPTTLLAMVDAAIGGKTAVNFGSLRNMVGTFALPEAVLFFPELLKTLPESEIRSGAAEMLKHAILESSSSFETFVQIPLHELSTEERILKSAQFKQNFIAGDLHDRGKRQLLNAGHTLAHALEAAFLELGNPLSHGFAVAAGLWIEAELALNLGFANRTFVLKLQQYIRKNYSRIELSDEIITRTLQFMHADKKNTSGIAFCLPLEAGNIERMNISDETEIIRAVKNYTHA
jgi:3-dehydroquinate synthase